MKTLIKKIKINEITINIKEKDNLIIEQLMMDEIGKGINYEIPCMEYAFLKYKTWKLEQIIRGIKCEKWLKKATNLKEPQQKQKRLMSTPQ